MTDADPPRSKTQRKRDMLALQALGETLIDLPASQLATIPVPERVLDAVEAARSMTARGALHRQKQYIGKLMRQIDAAPIAAALERLRERERTQVAQHHRVEAWRDRLIAEGDAAISAFVERYPAADRQPLRQLVRAAQKNAAAPAAAPPAVTKAARQLFRHLRKLMNG